jgi:hypothetical protein
MSTQWRTKFFEKIDCKGIAINEGQGEILVQGEVKSKTPNPVIVYWAPNPPTYTTSFTGSALPYHDSIQAYNRTPNIGATQCSNRKFEFRIKYPNSYYIGLGSLFVPPHVHFKICEESTWEGGTGGVRFVMPDPNSLNSPSTSDEEVNNKDDVNNKVQEAINSDDFHTIQIDEGIPFRSLTYPSPPSKSPRDSPMFYYCNRSQLPIRGQEQVLRDGGFPEVNKMPDNFWGLKPPL